MFKDITRARALSGLEDFLQNKLSRYERERNTDYGSAAENVVSGLSPFVRHRLLSEEEIVKEVLRRGSFDQFEKFIQEVFWRTYWKGWLELRPSVWAQYQEQVRSLRITFQNVIEPTLQGQSGLDFFDQWTQELLETGYLHNHTRMWWASIWIHTLKLPWQLGADFFLKHLRDGDPASNTLSWRWVAGLQTKGKAYLASPENIAKYSRVVVPESIQLASQPAQIPDLILERRESLQTLKIMDPHEAQNQAWLVHEEDLLGDITLQMKDILILDPNVYQLCSAEVMKFKKDLIQGRFPEARWVSSRVELEDLLKQRQNLSMVAPHVGPLRDFLDSLDPALLASVTPQRRAWDQNFFPFAVKGFFSFKENIPGWIRLYL